MTPHTADLLATLARIQAEAQSARHKFQQGLLPSGRTALRRIEEDAQDALSRAKEEVAA